MFKSEYTQSHIAIWTSTALFIILDIVIRQLFKKHYDRKLKRERQEAMDEGLKLDFSHEATTLKRVEVNNPKAKIVYIEAQITPSPTPTQTPTPTPTPQPTSIDLTTIIAIIAVIVLVCAILIYFIKFKK